eukprot:scaffold57472_cov66-Phaeocystis_antarctica.AAC.1
MQGARGARGWGGCRGIKGRKEIACRTDAVVPSRLPSASCADTLRCSSLSRATPPSGLPSSLSATKALVLAIALTAEPVACACFGRWQRRPSLVAAPRCSSRRFSSSWCALRPDSAPLRFW